MSKSMYVGVDGTAHKVKKAYVGVDGVARKVKKGYVGVDGVARQFFSSGEFIQYGLLSATLPTAVYGLAGASIGGKAIFAGGSTKGSFIPTLYDTATLVDGALTVSSIERLSVAAYNMTGVNTKTRAFFVGGTKKTDSYHSGTYTGADYYDASLTHGTMTLYGNNNFIRYDAVATESALFAVGVEDTETYRYNIRMYNEALTAITLTNPPSGSSLLTTQPISVGKYAIFPVESGTAIYIYDESGTLVATQEMQSSENTSRGGSSEENRAILFPSWSLVYWWNKSLVQSSYSAGGWYWGGANGTLACAHVNGVTTSIHFPTASTGNQYKMFDESMTMSDMPEPKTVPRYSAATGAAGDYMLYAGGQTHAITSATANKPINTIEAYKFG